MPGIRDHIPNCPVFPIRPGTKIPLVRWSEPWDGVIEDGAPYGIPTGPRSGVWVLDLDRKGGHDGLQSFTDYAEGPNGGACPDTLTVRTPSGGLHLYYICKDLTVANRAAVLPGVDVRGAGGYVVGPGSPGYSVVAEHPRPYAPEWLLALVRGDRVSGVPERGDHPATPLPPDHPEYAYRVRKAVEYLEKVPPCIEGQGGDAQLWAVALHLTRALELPVHACMVLIQGYNNRCLPPWGLPEVERKLTEAQANGTTACGIPPEMFGVSEGMRINPAFAEDAPLTTPNVRDPFHQYTFDIRTDLGGSGKAITLGQADISCYLMGRSEPWAGVWQYDEFRRRIVAVNPPLRLNAETSGFDNTDIANIVLWFAGNGYSVKSTQIEAAVKSAASTLRVHPVRQYLDALPRIAPDVALRYFEGIAGRLWGAESDRDRYESACLARFAIAAVRRVRRPGTKVDTMLVFYGEQGTYKSRFGAHLFGEFFTDQMPMLASTNASIQLQGIWCAEMAEMQAMRNVTEEVRKEFLSRCVDRYRPPYERDAIDFPRQTVFYGTTNADDFLSDGTGARRYDICEVKRHIDLSFSRDEFWAAANALEAAGVSHFEETGKSADEYKEGFHHEDPWDKDVLSYAKGKAGGYVTAADVLRYGIPQVTLDKQDARAIKRVQHMLRKAFGPSKVRRIDGRAQRTYDIPHVPAPDASPIG